MSQKLYTLLFALFFFGKTFAASLAPDANRPLIDHLLEVNQEWSHQVKAEGILLTNWQFNSDQERIQMHLMLVEHYLRSRPVDQLNARQQANRLHQLDVLHDYWQAGKFPHNSYHQVRQPYFVDVYGTACAVGYLALQSGEKDLVDQIRQENNYAYVRELDYPELMAWADKNGLTAEELAWIQPGYQPTFRNFAAVGNGGGVEGHINKMVKSEDGERLYIAGDFTEIDGISAGSVIAWDGTDWVSLGNGVNGEIHDMKFFNNRLYVVGDFELVDDPQSTNIAYYDGTEWVGLQQGDMQGSVYTLINEGTSRLYVGGDFLKIDGADLPYLAKFENDHWTNTIRIFTGTGYEEIPGVLSVNAPVHCLAQINNRILVGGDFTATAPGVDHEAVNSLEGINYLAYWQYDSWVAGLYGNHDKVRAVAYHQGTLLVGGVGDPESEMVSVSSLQAGFWQTILGFTNQEFENPGIHAFLPMGDQILAVGEFFFAPFGVGTFGTGAATLSAWYPESVEGFANFDQSVNTAIEYKGEYFFGGKFTEVNGAAFGGIVKLAATVNGIADPNPHLDLNAFVQGDQLVIRYHDLDPSASLSLYNLNGQQLAQVDLEGASGEKNLWIGDYPAGTYVYRVLSGHQYQSGKVVRAR